MTTAAAWAYAVVESSLGMAHHHAVMQVEADGTGTRLEWTVDLLPDDVVAPRMEELMSAGAQAISRALT